MYTLLAIIQPEQVAVRETSEITKIILHRPICTTDNSTTAVCPILFMRSMLRALGASIIHIKIFVLELKNIKAKNAPVNLSLWLMFWVCFLVNIYEKLKFAYFTATQLQGPQNLTCRKVQLGKQLFGDKNMELISRYYHFYITHPWL